MKTVKLIAREDREIGILGYVVEGTREIAYPMASLEGRLIAHDIIEHVNGVESIGSIDDELEALGAAWYVRGQWGNISSARDTVSPHTHIASDILELARIYVTDGVDFRSPVPRVQECEFDDDLFQCLTQARSDIPYEIDEEDMDEVRVGGFFEACIHYLRRGVEKAKQKYPDSLAVNTLFWSIAEACDPYVKNPEYEGQSVVLRYCLFSGEVTCEELWEGEEY